MAPAVTDLARERHPWLDAFLAGPAIELDNLLSGHGRIEPYEKADAPDAARLLFGGLPEGDEALAALDRAMREWLDRQRVGGVPGLERLPLERWLRKVSEAFEIVALLKLRHTVLDLRQRFVVWSSWCDRLAISEQRDGRYAFFRTLALTQRVIAEVEPTVNPFALEPLWLRVCEQAGSAFPKHYLGIGLLGLRMLPEREGAPPERPWMAGLINWAIGQKSTVEKFSQQWWALKGLYPRMPSYWRRATSETLRQGLGRRMPSELKEWWLHDVAGKERTIAEQSESRPLSVPELPSRDTHRLLLTRASDPLHSIKDQIEAHICGYRRFTEATGDSYNLVRTACNFGKALIEGIDDSDGLGQLAVDLARQALAWEPANAFAWALWRDALAKRGAFEAAELVGWESILRLPEDAKQRTGLALLLANWSGREAEAEDLLRETMKRFREDVVARNQLAQLLAKLPGREAEAEDLLRETMKRFREDVVARNQLAQLLAKLPGREAEAEDLLRETLKRTPTDVVARTHLAQLLAKLSGRGVEVESDTEVEADTEAEGLPVETLQRFPADVVAHDQFARLVKTSDEGVGHTAGSVDATVQQRGRLRRIFFEIKSRQGDSEWRRVALEEVRRVLSEDPSLGYARYLSRELEGEDGDGSVPGTFAIAFIDALKRKDADQLSALGRFFPDQTLFVDVAKVSLFGDRAAADRALIWFAEEARSEARAMSALRGFLKQRVDISTVKTSDAFVELVASNDNIQTDLIESVLAGDQLLLAA